MLERLDHLCHEALGVHVEHLRTGVVEQHAVAHGVHQVRFAQSDTTIDEKRVVDPARVVADLHAGSAGQLIGLALDETVEGEIRVGVGLELRRGTVDEGGWRFVRDHLNWTRGRDLLPGCTADLETNDGRIAAADLVHIALEPLEVVLPHPVEYEGVGRHEAHATAIEDTLQRPYPGVELLVGNLAVEAVEAMLPEVCGHTAALKAVFG